METIRLFDIQNDVIVPTEHCFTIKPLKMIMDKYPENCLEIYQYIFYMTCPNPVLNPFFNVVASEKEDTILANMIITGSGFSLEDPLIMSGVEICKTLYSTPTFRAYMGISSMLDRLAKYMEETPIEHGRDGNINSIVNAAAKFELIRSSFKGAYKDLAEEQKGSVRGGQSLSYDQM